MSTYALANTSAQWFARNFPGARIDPNCGVLHTTEGTSWPSYNGGASAPHYTVMPHCGTKLLEFRAHFPDEMSARALQNDPGGVETNTANAIQVELIGTCSRATRDDWVKRGLKQDRDFLFWPEAPAWALEQVARFIADMNIRHGIPIDGPSVWLPYPASFGQSNKNRMSFDTWRTFRGWCGHQHVPENDHGDPGALAWSTIEALAKGGPVKPKTWRRPAWPRPRTRERVGYHNVFDQLSREDAKEAFDAIRATDADIIGLGEWGPSRKEILNGDEDFIWVRPDGLWLPIGASRERYGLVSMGSRLLAKGRRVELKPGGQPSRRVLPDNRASLATFQERATGDLVTVLNVHYPSASSHGGILRRIAGALTPRARMARECKRSTSRIVKRQWKAGRRVYVVGDTNIHNIRLTPLISCWKGNKLRPTLNRSTYDVVLAQQPAGRVQLVDGPSDHKGVVASYPGRN